MKVTRRQLKRIIESNLFEQDLGFGDYIPGPDDTTVADEYNKGIHPIASLVQMIWSDVKKNPGKVNFPMYAFLRYLAGESSDFTEKELAKVRNGQQYIDELARILDIAALPFGDYIQDHKTNGYALNYNGQDVSFYLVDYNVFLGRGGSNNLGSAWLNALNDKGTLAEHLAVTIGSAGTGGSQAIKSRMGDQTLIRPDLQNGEHRLVNEFDFSRLADKDAANMNFGEVMKFYVKDFAEVASKGVVSTISYLSGRTLNSVVKALSPSVKSFKYDLIIKSNTSNWPDMKEYPFPKSGEKLIDNKVVQTIPGQESKEDKKLAKEEPQKNTDMETMKAFSI
jgi:hypothetical protein